MAALEAKTENSSDESLFEDIKPTASKRIIQPLTKRETVPDRAMQMSNS